MPEVTQVPQTGKDPETMTLAELRAAAEAEARAQNQPTTDDDQAAKVEQQARDPKTGRFTVREEDYQDEVQVRTAPKKQQEEVEDEEPETTIYRRVIDLGDGSGPEVFEADSLEELVDKIADAKAHATKKIRQQEAELREVRNRIPTKPEPKVVSDDAEYVYSQELMKKPTQAFKKIFKELTGRDIEDIVSIADRNDMYDRAQRVNNSIASFLTTHPDYVDSPKNSAAMTLALQGKETTGEELHKAYLHLKKSGLLELQAEQADADTGSKTKEPQRIVETKVERTEKRTTKKSSIGTQNRVTAAPQSQEPSEDDLYSMPMDKLKSLANKQMSSR